MVNMSMLRDFLDEVQEKIVSAEPGEPYLAIPGAPENVWKTLYDYSYSELDSGDGFECTGDLVIQMTDVRNWPGWREYVNVHQSELKPGESTEKIYVKFISETEGLKTPFVLEEFVQAYENFYLDFLNEKGIEETDIEISGNVIRIITDNIAPEEDSSDE